MDKYHNIEDLNEVKEPNNFEFITNNINKNILKQWAKNFNDIMLNIDTHYNYRFTIDMSQ